MSGSKTAVELIQAGAKIEAEDAAEALAMGDGDFRRLLIDLAPEGEDECGWVSLFSRGVIKRTRVQLGVIEKGLARAAATAHAAGDDEWQRWGKERGWLKHAIGARIAQADWAAQQLAEASAKAELDAVLKVLNEWRVAAGMVLASTPGLSAKRKATAHLELIHAVDAARGASRKVDEVKAALLAGAERAS